MLLTDFERYRLYEILPAASVWLTILIGVVGSFFFPLPIMYAVIIFDLIWVLRVLHFCFFLLVAWRRFVRIRALPWPSLLRRDIRDWQEYRHLIFLTLVNENVEVVISNLRSLRASMYEGGKFAIVLAAEGRFTEHAQMIFSEMKKFLTGSEVELFFFLHPPDLPDEIPGKGSNLHYAETQMNIEVEKRGWNERKLIVSIFDIDTVCHPAYFSYLTHRFASHPRPDHASFQPVVLFDNNLWDSPAPLRLMAFGTTFWLMTTLARQDTLVTFSSHSMSYIALKKAGWHEKRIVSEDSRIFYQCLLSQNGDYEVVPLYIPVSMDTVRDDSFLVSLKNLYKQQRRWAWGVEHVPYLLDSFRKNKDKIPFLVRFKWLFVEWEGKWSWCTVAIILTVIGRLPLYFADESLRESAFYANVPHVLEFLMTVALAGLFISAILSFPLLPPRPESRPRYAYVFMAVQWLLLPFSLLFLSAIPALDAVTRLAFGRYLGFNVSQKKRRSSG